MINCTAMVWYYGIQLPGYHSSHCHGNGMVTMWNGGCMVDLYTTACMVLSSEASRRRNGGCPQSFLELVGCSGSWGFGTRPLVVLCFIPYHWQGSQAHVWSLRTSFCHWTNRGVLDTLQLSWSSVNSLVRSYLLSTPVGVGVGTSFIYWQFTRLSLPVRVWLKKKNNNNKKNKKMLNIITSLCAGV